MANNTFKCRIVHNPDGTIRVTSYSNRKIHAGLIGLLNSAVHQVQEEYNQEAPWKKLYIRFEHEGINYEQVDGTAICEGCVFNQFPRCKHPYYMAGTKGICDGKIYIKSKNNRA